MSSHLATRLDTAQPTNSVVRFETKLDWARSPSLAVPSCSKFPSPSSKWLPRIDISNVYIASVSRHSLRVSPSLSASRLVHLKKTEAFRERPAMCVCVDGFLSRSVRRSPALPCLASPPFLCCFMSSAAVGAVFSRGVVGTDG